MVARAMVAGVALLAATTDAVQLSMNREEEVRPIAPSVSSTQNATAVETVVRLLQARVIYVVAPCAVFTSSCPF